MSLINDPRNPYSHVYTVDRLGNIVGGADIRYVNTTTDTMKKLAINVLKSGNPVWFGCDVGKPYIYIRCGLNNLANIYLNIQANSATEMLDRWTQRSLITSLHLILISAFLKLNAYCMGKVL